MSTAPSVVLSLSAQDRARVEQVEALARQGRAGLPELLPLLDDPSWAVRRAVVAALARLGDDALAPLCGILRSQRNNEARLAAAVDAIAASSGNVLPSMVELASSSRPSGRHLRRPPGARAQKGAGRAEAHRGAGRSR